MSIYVYVYICICVYTYLCKYVYVYICICVYWWHLPSGTVIKRFAIENGHRNSQCPQEHIIFHSYFSLPKGKF